MKISLEKKLWDIGHHHVKSRKKSGTNLVNRSLMVLQGHLMYVCVTINMKSIVVHDNIDIGGSINVHGSMKLSGLLGEVCVALKY